MKAGRELEKLIAAQVMGLKVVDNNIVRDGQRSGIPRYSTNIADAWQVVEKMESYYYFELKEGERFAYDCIFIGPSKSYTGEAETAPLAICLSALKTIGIDGVYHTIDSSEATEKAI